MDTWTGIERTKPMVDMALAALAEGDFNPRLYAERFGINEHDAADLRDWPVDRRRHVLEWLFRP